VEPSVKVEETAAPGSEGTLILIETSQARGGDAEIPEAWTRWPRGIEGGSQKRRSRKAPPGGGGARASRPATASASQHETETG